MSKPTPDKPTTDKPDRQPWDQLETESPLWFDRFLLYLSLGPMRSVLNAYQLYREKHSNGKYKAGTKLTTAGSWSEASHRYNWLERTAAYDTHINEQFLAELPTLATSLRQQRLDIARRLLVKIGQGVDALDVKDERSGALASAMKNTWREIRLDMGEPSDRRSVDVRLLHKLPLELQEAIIQALNQAKSGTK